MAAPTEIKRYYLAYGSSLHPKLLATTLGRIAPLSSVTVQVPSAFLSFDYRGVPFVEPCYTSALVKGVNDQGWKQGLDAQSIALDGVEGPRYRQYIWERCCPGLDFTGDLPPVLEGVAYELSEAHWTALTSDPSLAPLLPVQCNTFASGDPAGKSGSLIAHLPGLVDPSQRAPNLQPTTKYLRLVLIGAFFSTLSQPYLGHLTLLRPYAPTSLRQRLAGLVMTTLLMPPFLVGVVGSWIGRDWRGQGVRVWEWSGRLERWSRSFTGSGYRNDA